MTQATPEAARGASARATLQVMLAACAFGTVPIFTVLGTRAGITLLGLLAIRFALATAALIAMAGGVRALRLDPRRAAMLVLLAGGGQSAIAVLTLTALDYVSVATLGFLFYTYPAWVAIIAAARGMERLTTQRALALALALAGIVTMVGVPGSGTLDPRGVALALVAAVVYAAYIPMMARRQEGIPPAVTATYTALGVMVLTGAAAIAMGELTLRLTPTAWWATIALALVSTVLPYLLFLRGLAVLGPVRTAIVSTVEPFWTTLLGAVVLGQPMTARTLAGGVLIAAAVLILQGGGRHRVRR
jgi:drug/metabolite transporter (DMT)-like permease